MALKQTLGKKEHEALPEALRSLYVKEGDGDGEDVMYILDVEGEGNSSLKSKIKEFRESNIALKRDKEALEKIAKRFQDVDPDRAQEALELLGRLEQEEEGKLIKSGKIDEVFQRRLANVKKEHETQLSAIRDENKKLKEQNGAFAGELGSLKISGLLSKALDKAGGVLKKGASGDLTLIASQDWAMDDSGNVVLKNKELFNADGKEMSMDEYAAHQVKTRSYLFEPSTGGGAGGGNKGGRQDQVTTIDGGDPVAFGKNLAAIASGKVNAPPPSGSGF